MKKEEREAMLREHLAEMKKYENEIWARGIKYIAGVDEVGRGPLAGTSCGGGSGAAAGFFSDRC